MANIAEYLEKILASKFGRDVRGSIHDAIKAINEESTSAAANAAQAASDAQNAVNATEAATESANTAAASANEAAEKANAAASGDLSEKTTTYTESTEESPPASGGKLPAIIGWCIGKIKALVTKVTSLDENVTSLNSNINSLVKTKTLERTTSTAGNINLSMGDFVLVGVLVQNYNYMAVPFLSVDTGQTFAKILNNSLEIVSSTDVTVKVWYI